MVSSFSFAPFVFLLLVIGGTARPLYPLPGKGDGGSRRPLQTFRPYNVAHRGSNGEIPEETRQAYLRAIEEGADFIETDILSSKDGVLICFHDVTLDETTDIAKYKEFANRKRTYEVQGVNTTGFFTVDFTLKELKSLRVNQRYSFRDQQYNGKFQIPTFEEFINIALDAPRVVGIYPEIKNPVLINQYVKWSDGKRFEDNHLLQLHLCIYQIKRSLPKIFLIDDVDIPTQDTNQSYWEITSDTYLDYIKQYIVGIGPWKDTIVPVTKNYVTNPSDLVARAHARNLQVHPYTYRNENQFLHFNFSQDPYKEYDYWINKIGVDGLFTDFTGSLHNFQEWTSPNRQDDKIESELLHKIALLVSPYE
ncbi:Glycerophosphodiester phosphodiesterase domain-containing protein 5 [Trifolium repens]|nr:Glycerophosphodiester phosphodiesterase domain-containing protein 5 [Trifolium repens]